MIALIKHALGMRRIQSAATFCSVVLASAVVFALALSFVGVQGGLDTSRERLGADLMVIPADAAVDLDQNALLFTGAPANMYIDEETADRAMSLAGVERATVQFYGQTLDASCCTASSATRLVGYDASTDWVIAPWTDQLVEGRLKAAQIAAGFDAAGDFERGGKVLGRNVELVASLEKTGTDLDGSVLMDIDQVRAFVKDTPELQYLWDEYGSPDELVSCVLIDVAEGQRDAVVSELAAMGGIAVIESSQAVDQVAAQLSALFSIMLGAAALLVAATLFQLFARFFSLAWDRRSELALYRALGASRKDISLLIVGEAAALVGGGVVGGLVLGAVLYLAVPSLLAQGGAFPFIAPGPSAIAFAALGVLVLFAAIGFAAVAWPLARAGRVDPASAMQMGDID